MQGQKHHRIPTPHSVNYKKQWNTENRVKEAGVDGDADFKGMKNQKESEEERKTEAEEGERV